ncbi:MAG: hypothetical protein AVO35_00930 [Candidatus Aegiribacteria sp. MLS_C]|nr:MAG: hypothetical protein AVO35_00930 [Candidatus Aegiribacteria sp. MLS_C]
MMQEPPATSDRVLLKLSGEVLAGGSGHGIDASVLEGVSAPVLELSSQGCGIGIVVGGGNFIRGRDLASAGRITGDQMGMLATMINGLALRDALRTMGGAAAALSAIPVEGIFETFSPDLACDYLDRGFVVIYVGGTGNPLLTTDTAAALRAVQTGCSRLLKGTKVDGVYDADPESVPGARKYATISYDQVLRSGLKVMDAAAVAICREAGLPISVFDVWKPENIVKVYRDPSLGSLIGGYEDDR